MSVNSAGFTVSPAAASQLVYTTQPAGATAGSAFGTQPVVTVEDPFGNTVTSGPDSTVNVTATIQTGSGSLQGTTTKSAIAGVATFTDLRIDTTGGHTLHAASSVAGVDSAGFAVSPAAPDHLAFDNSFQPSSAAAGNSLGTVKVDILDQFGNLTADTSNVTVAIKSGTGDPAATLSGTKTVAAVAGVATFTGLSIDKAAAGYQLHATDGSLTTADSTTFTITHGAATQVVVSSATGNLTSGATRTITATIEDAGGNTVTADNSTSVTFSQSGGSGAVSGLAGAVTVSGGVATKLVTGTTAGRSRSARARARRSVSAGARPSPSSPARPARPPRPSSLRPPS